MLPILAVVVKDLGMVAVVVLGRAVVRGRDLERTRETDVKILCIE
jgi:hypothetical protein